MRAHCALLLLLSLALPACTHTSPTTPPTEARAAALNPKSLPIFDAEGTPADWPTLVSACKSADIVLLGENHNHPVGLPFAAALWRDILADSPNAALALEFFERDEQSRLDEYLAGAVDETTFRKRTQRTASSYPEGHRAMVEAAKEAGRPVIAANAPRPVVRLARLEGYNRIRALPPELQRMVRIPDSLPTGRYHDDFVKLMTGQSDESTHQPTADPEATARAEAMFLSQSMWDWTMAESVVRASQSGNHPVVLVVGRFHVDHDGGLVQAIHHMSPTAKVVVVSTVDETSTDLRDTDKGRATFVTYVGQSPAASK